jgi:DNA anti-recombination protein RmuC
MHFYQRTATGAYIEMQPDADGVIRSQILPGFQFRRRDLKRLPSLEELALDPVYQGYVLLRYQAAAQKAEQERQRAEQEQQRAEQERQRAEQERQRAEQEQQRAERFAALLREMGVDVDQA